MNDISDLTRLIQNGKLVRGKFSDHNAFFDCIAKQLVEEDYVNPDFFDALVNREDKYPTGLVVPAGEISIPHVEGRYIKEDALVVAIFDEPVNFYAMDNRDQMLDVQMAFVLLIRDPEKHLSVLKQLVRVVQSPKLMCLLDAHTKTEVMNLLSSV